MSGLIFVQSNPAQTFERRLLVAEGLEEGKRRLLGIEGLLSQRGNRFLDLDCVQGSALLSSRIPQKPRES
jgi:hypothetical protein